MLTVTESKEGIKVRQDRFLETGRAEGEQNETIWWVLLRDTILNSFIDRKRTGMFPWAS